MGTENEYLNLDHLHVDRRLKCLLGSPLAANEKKLWLAMSKDQRERAMDRMKAIVRWQAGNSALRPTDAAATAKLTINHFYEMAKAWRKRASLVTVEVLAAAPRVRSSDYEEVLERHVKAVIDGVYGNEKIVLKALAEKLGEAAANDLESTPSFATLRRKVQEELRRRERVVRPGGHLQFDCCAATMSTLDNPQRTMFAVIDARTQLVLGVALGDVREARLGYAFAAIDALRRLESGSLKNVAWSAKVENMELVVGVDDAGRDDDLLTIGAEASQAAIRPPIQPAIAAKRFGRYLRKAIGDRMGRVLFLPSDSLLQPNYGSVPDVSGRSDDAARFQVEVEIHNAAILPDLERDLATPPPAQLLATLQMLKGWAGTDDAR